MEIIDKMLSRHTQYPFNVANYCKESSGGLKPHVTYFVFIIAITITTMKIVKKSPM